LLVGVLAVALLCGGAEASRDTPVSISGDVQPVAVTVNARVHVQDTRSPRVTKQLLKALKSYGHDVSHLRPEHHLDGAVGEAISSAMGSKTSLDESLSALSSLSHEASQNE